MSDLDNFFQEDAPNAAVAEEVIPVTPELQEVAPVDKVEEVSETTAQETDYEKLPSWAKASIKDERTKRQELEKRASELESQLKELQQPKQQPEIPDFYTDPDKRLQFERQEIDQKLQRARIDMSEMMVKQAHEDYEEVVKAFEEAATKNPYLANQMLNHANPALFAYQEGLKHIQLKDMQDPEAYKAKLEAELREKIKAELLAENEKLEHERKKLSTSITDARGIGSSRGNTEAGDDSDPFSNLFDPRTRYIKR